MRITSDRTEQNAISEKVPMKVRPGVGRLGQIRRLLPLGLALAMLGALAADQMQAAPRPAGKPAAKRPAARNANAKSAKSAKPATPPPARRPVTIDKVDAEARDRVQRSAAEIDRLIEAGYAEHKIKPNPLTSDEVFVRRAYLEITGTIPTVKQTEQFLAARDSQKRARLIDQLLNSPGYASNYYNYWCDILRVSERLANNVPGRPYAEWIRQSLETNKPYDDFVREMLTAEGKIFDNPAAGYVLRDTGMPLDAMNNTVRVFLGTQIGCAQCHNHPFDRWTQKEFYQMAAVTAGTHTRRPARDPKTGKNMVTSLREELKKVDPTFDGGGKYNKLIVGNLFEVWDNDAKLRVPHDYRYDDMDPKAIVTAKAIFDPPAKIEPGESPREVFANWMTSKDNPRFAKAIANRLWAKVFGRGQIEPVDDLRDDSVAAHPELMEFLTREMVRLDFDMKEYLRILLNTKTWQREATSEDLAASEPYYFPGPLLRRMTAEQVWDSFITLAVHEPDEYQIEPYRVQAKLMDIDLASATPELLYQRDQQLRELTGPKARQARNRSYQYKGLLLVRAAELPKPAPAGHFLREFGQSDLESISASSTDGSVPQVLQMFNGPITHMLLENKSLLYDNVTDQPSVDGRINTIFLSILSRKPTHAEKQVAEAEIREHKEAGYGNVIWALVNTREFLFIQ
jgi:hypothetical protein